LERKNAVTAIKRNAKSSCRGPLLVDPLQSSLAKETGGKIPMALAGGRLIGTACSSDYDP
jgi:hypothetical protein